MKRACALMLAVWSVTGAVSSVPSVAAELVHEVSAGESASSIARRYYGGFEFTDLLLRYNGKTEPVIRPGEELRVPYSDVHTVRAGDTWSEIAQRYLGQASDYEVIAWINDLEPAEPLRVGGRVSIPVFLTHTLARGETLGDLAERYYGEAQRDRLLRRSNRIDDPRRLSVGQEIRIPLILPRAGEVPVPSRPRPVERNETTASVRPAKTEQTEPPASGPPAPPARRFVEPLREARRTFDAGAYDETLANLEPLIERVEREGNQADRTEMWSLLAFVDEAFDRTGQACAAFESARSFVPPSSLDPDIVSPKIRQVLAKCPSKGTLRAGR